MAKISKGILGAFSGKVGPVVGSNWRTAMRVRVLLVRMLKLLDEEFN